MLWKNTLQPASFRGVPFQVEGDDLTAGRRVQIHEFPQRDKPYAEDLGRATRKISVTAFLIGDDYPAQRDRLLVAVEEPGSGTLVHPYYGQMQVVVEECRVSHSISEGRMCRISLSFVEAGEVVFPTTQTNTRSVVSTRSDALKQASLNDFVRQFKTDHLPDFVTQSAFDDLNSILDFASSSQGGGAWQNSLSSLGFDALSLIGAPTSLAMRLLALFDSFESNDVASLAKMGQYQPTKRIPAYNTPTRQQEAANQDALSSLFRRGALAQAAKVSSESDWPVYDEAVQTRQTLSNAMDREMLNPGSDEVFSAMSGLRTATVNDISTRSAGSSRLYTVTPPTVMPAVTIAYDLYEDAGREEEIISRNRIRHAGFVPAEPIKVLSA